MKITVNWPNLSMAPSCGYDVTYRRKAGVSYLSANSSGSPEVITGLSTGSYEGTITPNCCAGNVGLSQPYGANCYQAMSVAIAPSLIAGPQPSYNFLGTTGYDFTIPYKVVINGTFTATGSAGVTNYAFKLIIPPSSSTSFSINVVDPISGSPLVMSSSTLPTISALVIASISPVYPGISIPDPAGVVSFCKPYWNALPDPRGTWDGCLATLPSFTLDSVVSNVANFSWIQSTNFNSGHPPNDYYSIKVSYGSGVLTGLGITPYTGLGIIGPFIAAGLGKRTATLSLYNFVTGGALPGNVISGDTLYLDIYWVSGSTSTLICGSILISVP